MKRYAFLIFAAAPLFADPIRVAANPNDDLFTALKHGDVAGIRAALDSGADPNAKESDGTPALHDAVLYGSDRCVALLLERGANPSARNAAGATALLWALGDPGKSRRLLEKGADPNAASGLGRTPLQVAAARPGNRDFTAELLKLGAAVSAHDGLKGFPLVPSGGGAATPLIEAAKSRDSSVLALLIANGADVNARDANGGSALSEAAIYHNSENVKILLAHGAKVDEPSGVAGYRPLMFAAMSGDLASVRALIAAGADVNAKSVPGDTALMWASYSDRIYKEVVTELLKAGADPAVRNKSGESALDWALRRGDTAVVRLLGGTVAPATTTLTPTPAATDLVAVRAAIAKAIGAMQPSGPVFTKKSGCISCHHQALPAIAVALARDHGLTVNDEIASKDLKVTLGTLTGVNEVLLEGSDIIPDLPITGGYLLAGLAAQHYPADRLTAAVVSAIAARQQTDGRWIGWSPRPPIEDGDIEATALAISAIRLYGPEGRKGEFAEAIRRARRFLEAAVPITTSDELMRVQGLAWADAGKETVRLAANRLLAMQRPDGGWAQLATLSSDAYATGEALSALVEIGALGPQDAAYRRGIAYLMSTRQADGTWEVQTRSYPFQPLVGTGFPHGRNEWISIAATAWATIALERALPLLEARR